MQITRTGKLKYDPAGSDLYARNPAPPARWLPKRCDFRDSSANMYYNVFTRPKMIKWMQDSPLQDIISGDFQKVRHIENRNVCVSFAFVRVKQQLLIKWCVRAKKESDVLFFVKQNPTRKKQGEEFLLQDEGQILLQSETHKAEGLHCASIVLVGDKSSSGYNARSTCWMLVRNLQCNT